LSISVLRTLTEAQTETEALQKRAIRIFLIVSVVTNSSTCYLNTIANSQEFSLFKIVFQ